MAGAVQAVHLWKEWGIQVLVLVSFTLQVTLLIFGELRRCVDSDVLRLFTWSAYQMADSVAIFTLGHMAVAGRLPDHELVALWASFLLVHLGGQDNITAYAIEDTKLWLRHLQTLVVQVAAAAYVLYASSIFGHSMGRGYHSLLLQVATILMFVVGAVKYGERVWALQYASGSVSASNKKYRNFSNKSEYVMSMDLEFRPDFPDAEYIVFLGHRMLDVPKDLLKGPLPYEISFRKQLPGGMLDRNFRLDVEKAYKMAEVQVSLMHDIFYTKAESQYGVTRVVSSLATAVALLLLLLLLLGSSSDRHNNNNDGGYNYNKVDVAITCVLSVGAGVLEVMSLLRYILSSFNWYRYEYWHWHWRVLTPLRRLVHASEWTIRYSWSRSMGQHNLLQVCAWNRTSWSSKMAVRLAVEDWWNTLVCSWSIPVSPLIKQMVVKQVQESCGVSETSPDHILNSRGWAVLKRKSQQLYDALNWSVNPDKLSLEESILIWHIATELYLSWYKEQIASCMQDDDDLAKAVEALSNYMLFLLAARPNMLPPSTSRIAYIEMCYCLTSFKYTSAENLTHLLRRYGDALKNRPGSIFKFPYNTSLRRSSTRDVETANNTALHRGSHLPAKLIGEESQELESAHMLKLIGKVWVELLCYASSRCSAYSHVKQLSDGGELITVIAFLFEYLKRDLLKVNSSTSAASTV
ncbi:hypothetical protein PR202_gb12257 [Eleusine coracana subsp. coracana]|uniref:DUF4220 domain-containing protein n=1 Tax=Eleusine coracana subsp. coracana TaxID=191504 RepID=A0AAV5EP43_ELECO|nr:hypothetical protein PR202_gb12257 [Eleusine coracana subsp. coracana]